MSIIRWKLDTPIGRKSMKVNSVVNILSSIIPLAISLATIPFYLNALGVERYGIIALIWLVFGYFGLFDLGLSRATANQMAQRENQCEQIQGEIFWTAMALNTLFGIIGAIILLLSAEPLFKFLGAVTPHLNEEFSEAIPWISVLIPLATISAVLTGALESQERFLELGFISICSSLLIQFLPLFAIIRFGPTIEVAVSATALARTVAFIPLMKIATRQLKTCWKPQINLATGKKLFAFGGWITVTNVVSPVLVSIDQLMISSILGPKYVSFFSIPFNLASKANIIPGAITRALFPEFSRGSIGILLPKAQDVASSVGIFMALVCVPCILLANFALSLWLGDLFATEATLVAQVIFYGVWFNGIALVPYTLLQGIGRPDLPAKFHILELMPFLALLWFLLSHYGLVGAAIASAIRFSVDAALLISAAKFSSRFYVKILPSLCAITLALSIAIATEISLTIRMLSAVVIIISLIAYAAAKDIIISGIIKRIFVSKTQ